MNERAEELSEEEVARIVAARKIAEAEAEQADERAKLLTIGGALFGFGGFFGGLVALLALQELVTGSILFGLSAVGFGLASPDQVASLLGRK